MTYLWEYYVLSGPQEGKLGLGSKLLPVCGLMRGGAEVAAIIHAERRCFLNAFTVQSHTTAGREKLAG